MKLTIHKANEKLVVELPGDIVTRLGWGSGDVLEAEVVGDAIRLVRIETTSDATERTAEEVMDDYSWTLEQLAKS